MKTTQHSNYAIEVALARGGKGVYDPETDELTTDVPLTAAEREKVIAFCRKVAERHTRAAALLSAVTAIGSLLLVCAAGVAIAWAVQCLSKI